ncbi:hypothetical protein TUBRATIS_007410 [Tubulinosema ratisbonensis]|uniref:Sm domain-containing protein n=1 Tax=Tubulinosema ratisbonensis TaxID=291195 RepID=A0A437ANI8_9MICR|nr:hypothetical protein TUBRATIS_007410 [Tubulinosema ratisbonensis]
MKSQTVPNFKNYLFKRVSILLKGKDEITGMLIGYDFYSNVTLTEAQGKYKGNVVVRGEFIEKIILV